MALICLYAALALLLSVDTVAASDPPRREIRFAVVAHFPPFQSRSPQGQLVGVNIELGNALCRQLNVRCTWVDQVLVENFSALEARQFDAIMGIAPTSNRRRWVSFTDELYAFTTRLVGRRASGLTPTVRSLKGKRVGVLLGSNREAFARSQWAPKGVIIKSFWLIDEVIRSLVAGEIDATLQGPVELRESLLDTSHGRDFAFLGPEVSADLLGSGVAIALRKSDIELLNDLNGALEQLVQNGEYQRIIQPYRLYEHLATP
ncbi:transporter substrate-binding domain-containing protein [Pseudomonas sp. O64]|uniref:transporter substrate-binding domain-containing protein n=1 Tax=Pseudomonas TaxID=286 RepID=UPI000BA0E954|nr:MULTISPECIES: transporter substrate-binding domain-containing protein [unclassified Pseudomonas]MCV2230781.1 transporter substrate-binding domain-containing protein [Pseudomonas sp. AU10]OZO03643.1 amino acid ABC transporter substrate-binding protein [Pseudomonas sp. IB20]UNM21084.1 transporter substrate-binding domain-containing protein [Pseudomonas sp. ArH3a]UXZ23830.1 transporter substrate-binding domain-containing protein [Pseudomonas sp. YeP6b]